jgi:pentapeptide MXKDX repeat protein
MCRCVCWFKVGVALFDFIGDIAFLGHSVGSSISFFGAGGVKNRLFFVGLTHLLASSFGNIGIVLWCFRRERGQVSKLVQRDSFDAMQCDAMRCDAMRCGDVVRCGVMRCDVMRCNAMRCGVMRCGVMRCDAVRCDVMRCDVMRCDGNVRCDAAWCSAVWYSAVWFSVVRCYGAMRWKGLGSGLVWFPDLSYSCRSHSDFFLMKTVARCGAMYR